MLNSALRSRAEYADLGVDGLAARTTPERDASIVKAVEELLEGRESVLDLCCGYGRIALPLRRAGKTVRALDISPNLIEAGKAKADEEELAIDWAIGSMTDLPYKWDAFDAVVCLWTAFHELFGEDEQISTICEISRVLKPGGIAIIEGPAWGPATAGEIAIGMRQGPEHRIVTTEHADGQSTVHYIHDEISYGRLCAAAGIDDYKVYKREWGGRRRLILEIHAGK
ncbi:class I SAM-dependent methyltransferase [Kribbella sandramycini]|uniref:Class I SAM-dependent methyltransferase n=1 Tax=Kribbella sandramycini TaxID=60450 RepID=A0A7Y4NZF6_9ACTN|nr:class I SAM-dependent methyltransferase [Kribbella sandramycini]MBB6565725.1 ubiquinone/menaquinone biosynthesis C-methylase UbiE [Kribbella sandramycini]NOL41987.1 class I SAM-dependent methyltransferase [Kribbella sandramycini]